VKFTSEAAQFHFSDPGNLRFPDADIQSLLYPFLCGVGHGGSLAQQLDLFGILYIAYPINQTDGIDELCFGQVFLQVLQLRRPEKSGHDSGGLSEFNADGAFIETVLLDPVNGHFPHVKSRNRHAPADVIKPGFVFHPFRIKKAGVETDKPVFIHDHDASPWRIRPGKIGNALAPRSQENINTLCFHELADFVDSLLIIVIDLHVEWSSNHFIVGNVVTKVRGPCQ